MVNGIKNAVSKKMVMVTTAFTLISQTQDVTKCILIAVVAGCYLLAQGWVDGKKEVTAK